MYYIIKRKIKLLNVYAYCMFPHLQTHFQMGLNFLKLPIMVATTILKLQLGEKKQPTPKQLL